MLTGKVIVVTGGAGLLGRAFCAGIAERGGTVVVADRNDAEARRVAAELTAGRRSAEAFELDVTDEVSIDRLIEETAARYGRIDAVVHSAYPRNANWGRPLDVVTYADFSENVSMQLGGYFLVAQRFMRHFKGRGGNIVGIGSIYGSIAPRFQIYDGTPMTMPVEYAAIKAGVAHLTRYFAEYGKRDGIRANCLSPGGILDRQPASFVARYGALAGTKGMLEAGDIVGALLFLLSDESRYVTGQNLIVDDGFSL